MQYEFLINLYIFKEIEMSKLIAAILVGMFTFTAVSSVAIAADDTHKKEDKKKDDKKGH